MKTCRHCFIQKPLTDFAPTKRNRDGRASYCHPCATIRNRAWRKAHPAKTKESQHKQWLRAKENGTYAAWEQLNHEKRLAQDRARCDPDKASIKNAKNRAEHPETIKTGKTRWNRENPGKVKMHIATRRARLKGAAINDFTDVHWDFLEGLYEGRCAYCNIAPATPLHRDHIISLLRHGDNTLSNILPSCQSCNSKKGTYKFIIPYLLRCADGVERPIQVLKNQ